MRKIKTGWNMLRWGLLTLSVSGGLLVGCDVDSTKEALTVSPGGVSMSPGETQRFTASGGHEYVWSLEPEDGFGMLNARSGKTVEFTLLGTPPGTNAWGTIVIHCRSYIPGVSDPGTNTTTKAYTAAGEAVVHFRTDGDRP